jgi:hypothetical protein
LLALARVEFSSVRWVVRGRAAPVLCIDGVTAVGGWSTAGLASDVGLKVRSEMADTKSAVSL